MEPASIRYKNPGAMWGNALAKKWGSNATVTLHDGLGQGNNIAVFPTHVQGISAQLDLWRSSKNYKNKPFSAAIAVWSGHNHVESYIAYVLKRVPGMTRNTVMNDEFWHSAMGIGFLKAQAGHEAGKPYPAEESDWIEAQRRVFAQAPVVKSKAPKAIAHATTGGGAIVVATHQAIIAGVEDWIVYAVVTAAVVALAVWVYKIVTKKDEV